MKRTGFFCDMVGRQMYVSIRLSKIDQMVSKETGSEALDSDVPWFCCLHEMFELIHSKIMIHKLLNDSCKRFAQKHWISQGWNTATVFCYGFSLLEQTHKLALLCLKRKLFNSEILFVNCWIKSISHTGSLAIVAISLLLKLYIFL